MAKGLKGLALLSGLLVQSSAFSWGSASYAPPNLQAERSLAPSNFPMDEDQAWYVKPSLLIWRPFQDDIDAGNMQQIFEFIPTIGVRDKTLALSFDWGTGVRVAIGRYLPNHENWDISAIGTYYYADAHDTYKGSVPADFTISSFTDFKLIVPGWSPFLTSNDKTSVHWHLNYFTFDLLAGRQYLLTQKLVLHPFIGLRAALIYEKYRLKTSPFTLSTTSVSVTIPGARFRAWNDYWGIGPRIGTDLAFYFGHGWTFLGSLSGSFLYSRYNIEEKTAGSAGSGPATIKVSDADTLLRTNLETSIGLGWEKWVRNNTVRIAPSFLFEVSEWFAFNNWLHTSVPTSSLGSPDFALFSERKNGDLGLMGFTINLQIDY